MCAYVWEDVCAGVCLNLCVDVCVCVCVCMCVHWCVHVCVCAGLLLEHAHVASVLYIYRCVSMSICVSIYIYVYTNEYAYVHVYLYIYICKYMKYIYIYMYIYTHICVYTQACERMCVCGEGGVRVKFSTAHKGHHCQKNTANTLSLFYTLQHTASHCNKMQCTAKESYTRRILFA